MYRDNSWGDQVILPQRKFNIPDVPGHFFQSRGEFKIREMENIVRRVPVDNQSSYDISPRLDFQQTHETFQIFLDLILSFNT